jgi:ArsR family transcriptional regulator
MKTTDALACLSALAHETRLAAFRHLVQIGPAGLPVGSLQEKLDVPPATLTAHLNILRSAGLVEDAREGRVIKVSAAYARMNDLLSFLTENCCAGSACAATPARSSAKRRSS